MRPTRKSTWLRAHASSRAFVGRRRLLVLGAFAPLWSLARACKREISRGRQPVDSDRRQKPLGKLLLCIGLNQNTKVHDHRLVTRRGHEIARRARLVVRAGGVLGRGGSSGGAGPMTGVPWSHPVRSHTHCQGEWWVRGQGASGRGKQVCRTSCIHSNRWPFLPGAPDPSRYLSLTWVQRSTLPMIAGLDPSIFFTAHGALTTRGMHLSRARVNAWCGGEKGDAKAASGPV